MCCFTHDNPHVPGELAASQAWRCRCECGPPQCTRKATREDLLCDSCRGPQPAPAAAGSFILPVGEDAGWARYFYERRHSQLRSRAFIFSPRDGRQAG